MNDYTSDKTLASGIFKFSGIPFSILGQSVPQEMQDDPNFLELSVRGCDGNDKFGIAFKYRHNCSTAGDFERLADNWRGLLLRKFPKYFVGWDISSWTKVIK
jgi:hypothetical protein